MALREAAHRLAHVVYVLIPGLLFGYLVMGLIWPWSIVKLDNPLQAMTYFSAFFEKPWKELFNGEMVSVPDMPWSYLPTLFALKLPEAMMVTLVAGLGVTVASLFRRDVPAKRKTILTMLALAATLPLMVAMVKRPALYNGIRHFLFVIPPMAVMAGFGFAWIIDRVKRQGAHGGGRRQRGLHHRAAAAADRDDPAASLSVHLLQSCSPARCARPTRSTCSTTGGLR